MHILYCKEKLFCQRCRENKLWRQQMNAPEICPEGITIANCKKKKDIYELCYGCKFEVIKENDVQGCQLIENGKPCTLHRYLINNGPWPEICPRRKLHIEKDVQNED